MEDYWSRDASALVLVVKGLSNGDLIKKELVVVYCQALRVVLGVYGGVCVLAMIASFCGTKSLSLDRELRTEQGWKDAGAGVDGGEKGVETKQVGRGSSSGSEKV